MYFDGVDSGQYSPICQSYDDWQLKCKLEMIFSQRLLEMRVKNPRFCNYK